MIKIKHYVKLILYILGIYSMRFVRHVVLDEADTLMDDSFNELMTHFLKRFHVYVYITY